MKNKPEYQKDDFEFSNTSSEDFIEKFLELANTKKQRKKDKSTVAKILKKLQNYDEPFAISLMDVTILNDYQGVIFSDTDVKYSNYLKQKHGNNFQQSVNLQGKPSKQQQFLTGSELFN
jgi:hypothetical protein